MEVHSSSSGMGGTHWTLFEKPAEWMAVEAALAKGTLRKEEDLVSCVSPVPSHLVIETDALLNFCGSHACSKTFTKRSTRPSRASSCHLPCKSSSSLCRSQRPPAGAEAPPPLPPALVPRTRKKKNTAAAKQRSRSPPLLQTARALPSTEATAQSQD